MNLGEAISIAESFGYICETRVEQYRVRAFTYVWIRNDKEEICLMPISMLSWTNESRFTRIMHWVETGATYFRYRRPFKLKQTKPVFEGETEDMQQMKDADLENARKIINAQMDSIFEEGESPKVNQNRSPKNRIIPEKFMRRMRDGEHYVDVERNNPRRLKEELKRAPYQISVAKAIMQVVKRFQALGYTDSDMERIADKRIPWDTVTKACMSTVPTEKSDRFFTSYPPGKLLGEEEARDFWLAIKNEPKFFILDKEEPEPEQAPVETQPQGLPVETLELRMETLGKVEFAINGLKEAMDDLRLLFERMI